LLLQYSATEKNRHTKGLDASDEKLIIKLELYNKYGNLFQMYYKIVDEDPYKTQ
jgi:succinate dehydrogenase / fumarate reductase flavoprotein subunit